MSQPGSTASRSGSAHQTFSADVARVSAIREAAGHAVEFILDANGGWTYDTAAAAIEAFSGWAWHGSNNP